MTEKVKLVGQLLDDKKPVTLAVEEDLSKIDQIAKEYKQVFPDIFLSCEWGYFKKPISTEKRNALAGLFASLNAPLNNVMKSLTN